METIAYIASHCPGGVRGHSLHGWSVSVLRNVSFLGPVGELRIILLCPRCERWLVGVPYVASSCLWAY